MSDSNALSSNVYISPRYQGREYIPKYCTVEDLEHRLQMTITEDNVPSIDSAFELIQEAEAEIDSKEWGHYIQSDEYLDGKYEILSFQWVYVGFFAQVVYPQHTNIIRVIRCHYNSGGMPSGDPIWTELKEGPLSGSHFVVLRRAVLKEQVGTALVLYSSVPYPGPLRIRLTYEYGMNVDNSLLREYASKLAGMHALEMRAAAENVNLNLEKGPWAAVYKQWKDRLEYMREELFPKKVRTAYIFPSIM